MSAQFQSAVLSWPVPQSERLRVAVICDFAEENWPSMDLVGDMLFEQLIKNEAVSTEQVRPGMMVWGSRPGRSARLFGRFVQYPRALRSIASKFDLFHIVDHSYAHLVSELPHGSTIVTCHDLDAFSCLLDPRRERRSFAFRAMTRRILSGLQAAAHVTCDTVATRDNILKHRLLPPERLTVVHNGVHPELSVNPDPFADRDLAAKLGRDRDSCPELVHVGSNIPRKRIDVLLRVFAEVRKHEPDTRLIRVGTPFTPQQESLAVELNVRQHIDCLEGLNTRLLASCYRRAAVVLQPSESEGFGLPVIEALACGASVVASDIPPLREIGGDAVEFCPVGDVSAWTNALLTIIHSERGSLRRSCALQQVSHFTWTNYANQMLAIYRKVLSA